MTKQLTIAFLMLQVAIFILAITNCVSAQVLKQLSITASSLYADDPISRGWGGDRPRKSGSVSAVQGQAGHRISA
jgi:hypothetical protein